MPLGVPWRDCVRRRDGIEHRKAHQPSKYYLIVKWTTGKVINVNQKKRSDTYSLYS